ncbi:MAG: hypothetical protein AB7U20_03895 [Planctomycetaceae bacterium]
MSKYVFPLISSLMVIVISSNTLLSDEGVFSGPQPGEVLPPLRVLAPTANSEAGQVDLVAEASGRPILLLFVHEFTRPSSALTRVLMNYGEMRWDDGLFPATIRLTDDPSSIRGARRGIPERARYGVSPDGKEGPGSYGLNRNVGVTVLVGNEGRVTASFALVQPSVTDASRIIAEIAKLIGGEVPTTAELEFLAMNQDAAPRFRQNGAAPEDPELRQHICGVLRAKDDAQALTVAAAAVEVYIGADAVKQRELGEASRLLLNQRYRGQAALVGDSPAGAHFRTWAKMYGVPPQETK